MKFQFTHARLYVEDWQTCRNFYEETLGLKEAFVSEVDNYVELTDGKVKISLMNRSELTSHFGSQLGLTFDNQSDSIALSFQVEDVEAARSYLKSKDVEIVSPAWNFADWGIKAVLVRDPDGNLIELTEAGEMVSAE